MVSGYDKTPPDRGLQPHSEIGDQFSDVADLAVLEEAVAEVTRDGLFDWAQKERREGHAVESESESIPPPGSPATFAGVSFAAHSFAIPDNSKSGKTSRDFIPTGSGDFFPDENGNRLVRGTGGPENGSVEALRLEVLDRMDRLEALIRQKIHVAPSRGHNHPPEMLEIERPFTQEQLQEVVLAITEIRSEGNSPLPSKDAVLTQASILTRFGVWLACTTGSAAVGLVVEAAFQSRQELYDAVIAAANAATTWALNLI